MEYYICATCKIEKHKKEFNKRTDRKKGICSSCKKCTAEKKRNYRKTIDGLISRIYENQILHSKDRKHNPPLYTKKELKEWLFSQELFYKLYDNWKKSNYKKELCPSIDRKNDYKGYSIDNIQLMTWEENRKKGHNDRINGINNKVNKKILQIDLDGNIINEFYSQAHAERKTGINQQNISSVCLGKRKSTGGFIWKFKI